MASNSMWNILMSKINSNKCSTDKNEVTNIVNELIKDKVDSVPGKGLSTNDYTNADKEKLEGLTNYDDTNIKKDLSNAIKNGYTYYNPGLSDTEITFTVNKNSTTGYLLIVKTDYGPSTPRGVFLVGYSSQYKKAFVDTILNTNENNLSVTASDNTITIQTKNGTTFSGAGINKIPISL